jgi:hypothetical protein
MNALLGICTVPCEMDSANATAPVVCKNNQRNWAQ